MLTKPLNLVLVYVMVVFNMAILASPMIALLVPFFDRRRLVFDISGSIWANFEVAVYFLVFLVSFLMILYLFLDFLFGFAVRGALRGCTKYNKLKGYEFLEGIFGEVKEKFGEPFVGLYIKNSDEINAFAVASMRRKAIVLSAGLVNHYLQNSDDRDEFLCAIRSIMGHEMSHLINKDFLPTYLVIISQKATYLVSWLLHFVFSWVSRVTGMVPLGGRFAARFMDEIYLILNFFFGFFNRFVVSNIYEFLRRFMSRSIEYRCDRQSAHAFGGRNMACALAFLGGSGYFTLFSTHPATKRRIKKVKNIEAKRGLITVGFVDGVSNYLALAGLVLVCWFFGREVEDEILFLVDKLKWYYTNFLGYAKGF